MARVAWWISRPKSMGVGCVIKNKEGDRVLLVKNTYRQGWRLCGGGLKSGEDWETAIRREVWEELGVKLRQLKFLAEITEEEDFKASSGKIYEGTIEESTPLRTDPVEIKAMKWFLKKELPKDMTASTDLGINLAKLH